MPQRRSPSPVRFWAPMFAMLLATLSPVESSACHYLLTLNSPQMNCNSVHLTWSWDTAPPGSVDYKVWYRKVGTPSWFFAGVTNVDNYDILTFLDEDTNYEFQIEAITYGVICPHFFSNITSGMTLTQATQPVSVTAEVLAGSQVRLGWGTPAPLANASVRIFRYPETTPFATVPYANGSYTYLETCPAARYRLQNLSPDGCDGAPSNPVDTKPLTPVLVSPANGAVVVPPVTMTWQAPLCPWIPEYLLQISSSPGFEATLDFHPTVASFSWTNPSPGLHYWRVKAVNGTQSSSFSAVRSFTTPAFSPVTTPFPGLASGTPAWGDYDNDGDLDVLLTGDTGTSTSFGPFTGLYRNNGASGFTLVATSLVNVGGSAAAWGDYDGDGDLDLLLCGSSSGYTPTTKVYRNDGGGSFTDIGAGLPGVISGSAQWGDVDRDGDLDFVLTGDTGSGNGLSRIYRNNGNGTFSDMAAGLAGVHSGDAALGDYDRDGDLDLALTGVLSTGYYTTRIYRNNGSGVFTDINATIAIVGHSNLDWADVDGDRDLDLALTGAGSGGPAFFGGIYRYMGGDVFELYCGGQFVGVSGALTFGDWSNDGDTDLFINGNNTSRAYEGAGNGCFGTAYYFEAVKYGGGAWGDFDNDQDLDLLQFGWPNLDGPGSTRLYRNYAVPIPNTPPSSPANLTAQFDPVTSRLTLSWSPATDGQTPSNSLTYNVRVGSSPGGHQLLPAMSAANGYRRVPEPGNARTATSLTITVPPGLHYYVAVQAIDAGFAGSAFTPEVDVDAAAPSAVTDLAVAFGRWNAAVSWRAVGDDGTSDPAALYEVRRSSLPITEATWAYQQLVASGVPQAPGTLECVLVNVLTCSQHYFAVKTRDEVGNWSAISNAAGGSTACSGSAPAPCSIELRTPDPEFEPVVDAVELPGRIELSSSNPQRGDGNIRYGIPETFAGQPIELAVFDLAGRRVATLLRGTAAAGRAQVRWNLELDDGEKARAGVYFIRLRLGDESLRRTVIVSR